jgi:hypothetical protein
MPQRMKHHRLLFGLLALGLLAWVALTAGQAQAATGVGPLYPKPAWNQKIDAATRFLVLTNWNSEAVLDKETGLVCEHSPLSPPNLTWFQAKEACLKRTIGNRRGWRLPSVHELASLVDPNNPGGNPDLPLGHPFTNVQSANYWTATTNAANDTQVWFVNLQNGSVDNVAPQLTGQGNAWCVRGGMNAAEH